MRPREFFVYHWAIQKRAWNDTKRFALEHVALEIAVAIAGAIALGLVHWYLVGQRDLVEAVGASLVGGVLTGIFLWVVLYLWGLTVSPAIIHTEQEDEISKHVPVKTPKSYRGIIDFAYDVERGTSANALTKTTQRIGQQAAAMGARIQRTIQSSQRSKSIAERRRRAIRIGKELQAMARRLRRLHIKYKKAASGFAESFVGAAPQVVASNPPEDVLKALEAAKQAREGTDGMKRAVGGARRTVIQDLANLQEEIGIGSEQLGYVLADIEQTASDLVQVFNKIIRALDGKSASRGRGRR